MNIVALLALALVLVGCGGGGGGDGGNGGQAPDVEGVYVMVNPGLLDSNCDTRLDAILTQGIDDFDGCALDVSQNGDRVTVEICTGAVYRGNVNDAGRIVARTTGGATLAGCAFTSDEELILDAFGNLVTVRALLDFADDCVYTATLEPVEDCEFAIEADWE